MPDLVHEITAGAAAVAIPYCGRFSDPDSPAPFSEPGGGFGSTPSFAVPSKFPSSITFPAYSLLSEL